MGKSKLNYKVYNGKTIKKLIENSRIFLLTLLFVIGLLTGATIIKVNSEAVNRIPELINSYISFKAEHEILQNFCNSITVVLFFFIINTFLGFSLIGYVFLTAVPLLKGLGLGAVSGYLYASYKLTGLAYCLLIIYPGAVVSTFALIIACNDSCEYSKNAYAKAIVGRGQFEKDETRIYLIRQLILCGVCAVSSAIDAFSGLIFSRFFEI